MSKIIHIDNKKDYGKPWSFAFHGVFPNILKESVSGCVTKPEIWSNPTLEVSKSLRFQENRHSECEKVRDLEKSDTRSVKKLDISRILTFGL